MATMAQFGAVVAQIGAMQAAKASRFDRQVLRT
jgi:hypothetical protein